jgi:hypothetical protein
MITAGFVKIMVFPEPWVVFASNNLRQQNELCICDSGYVKLTLAGGATPNNQVGDIVSFAAFIA